MSLYERLQGWYDRINPPWPEWSCLVCRKPQRRLNHDCSRTTARVFAPPLGDRPR